MQVLARSLVCLLAALATTSVSAKTVIGPASSNAGTEKPTLTEAFTWKVLDFAFESREDRSKAIAAKAFIPENNVPVGLEVWANKVFLTVPRWKLGVPASLGYIDKDGRSDSPVVKPYPNWRAHNLSHANPERIVSPFRVQADSCNRLWVLDTGVDHILSSAPGVLSMPQVIVYNLENDKRLRNFTVPVEQTVVGASFFANVAVDVVSCDETYAYLADLAGALVVYDWKRNRSWKIDHQSFKHSPGAAEKFNVNGVRLDWQDGIFGMALTETDDDLHRTMYYHAFASFEEFKVSTRVLRNETASMTLTEHEEQFVHLGSRGDKSQASAAFIDPNAGVVFYTQVNRNAIACFNYRQDQTDFSAGSTDLVAVDNDTLVFPNDVKVLDGELWVISDRMAEFIKGKLFPANRVNFRVFRGMVHDLVQDTKCASSAWTASAAIFPAVWLPLLMLALVQGRGNDL